MDQSSAITSKASVKASVGTALAYSVSATGTPHPAIADGGPAGRHHAHRNGDGTATLGGTPLDGSGGTYW